LQGQGLLRVERLPAATPEALLDRLRGDAVHVLHFMGHGYFDPGAKEGGLVLEDSSGRANFVGATQVGTMLRDHTAMRLIFLSACEGARGDREDAFAGVAQQLVVQGVPAVLAMQFPVSDTASRTLTQKFYEGVAGGEIARGMGISPSVAQKSIQALVAQGFARQNTETQMYELGSMAIQVGLAGLLRLELRQVARPYLQQLVAVTGESSFLGVRQGNGAVYIDKVLSETELRMDVPLGSWRPFNCTAVGKALLAHLPEMDLAELDREGAFIHVARVAFGA
jgi:hypothetical protein